MSVDPIIIGTIIVGIPNRGKNEKNNSRKEIKEVK